MVHLFPWYWKNDTIRLVSFKVLKTIDLWYAVVFLTVQWFRPGWKIEAITNMIYWSRDDTNGWPRLLIGMAFRGMIRNWQKLFFMIMLRINKQKRRNEHKDDSCHFYICPHKIVFEDFASYTNANGVMPMMSGFVLNRDIETNKCYNRITTEN